MNSHNQIEELTELEFAYAFQDLREDILKDPLNNFVRAQGFTDFEPSPAQKVALKIIFGQMLDTTTKYEVNMESVDEEGQFILVPTLMTEVQIYEYMTDLPYDPNSPVLRTFIDLIIGRRGGKSTISAVLGLFCGIKEDWSKYLYKHPHATVLVLSHTKEFSQEILEILRTMAQASPVLSRLMDKKKKNTQSTFNLKVPFIYRDAEGKDYVKYSRVQIKVGAASKKSTRGIAACAVLCDEIAFWGTEEKSAERDIDILRALKPAMSQFDNKAILIKLSSPGIKQGELYNEYMKRDSLPPNFVIFKAPSWVWNKILNNQFLATEYKLDPTGFGSEYRADFVDSLSDFISPEMVDLCVMRGVSINPPETKKVDVTYVAAIDAAFKGDRFTFTIAGFCNGRLKQYVMKAWEGNRKVPVKAHEVAQFIRTVCREYGISRVHADQYAFHPLKEIFEQYGLLLIETPFTNNFKKQIYYNLKTVVHNQKLDLLDHALTITEIKQLQCEQTSTGTVRIGHPVGGHDDCATVIAIASYLLTYSLHKAGIDVTEIAGMDAYDIETDIHGRSLGKAPSGDMLGKIYGYEIFDNSHLWIRDPQTGEYKKVEELEENEKDSGTGELGGDFIFG